MSAFMCNPTHVMAVALILLKDQTKPLPEFFKDLWLENKKSINDRYPDHPEDVWWSAQNFNDAAVFALADLVAHRLEDMEEHQAYTVLSCFDYQSCEHNGYETGPVGQLVRAGMDRLEGSPKNDSSLDFWPLADLSDGLGSEAA